MTNKIALVTGASRGLGKDMALQLASKGVDSIITYKGSKDLANETVKEIESKGCKAFALNLDMEKFDSIDPFITSLKQVLKEHWKSDHFNFLVNNAGMGATVPFEQVTEAMFDNFLNVHFKGVYFLTQKCLPLLTNGGRIINISSGSTVRIVPGYSVYSSMKGAIETFTKCLAKELGSRGITANVVAPGPIETDFNNAAIRNNPAMKTNLSNVTPLGRVGTASDIGGVVAFLCTDEAGWINGQRIEVAGGLTL